MSAALAGGVAGRAQAVPAGETPVAVPQTAREVDAQRAAELPAAQQTPVLPAALPASPAIQSAGTPALKQPPVEAAPNLPFAPEPRLASAPVLSALSTAKPTEIVKGVTTPVSNGQALRLTLDDAVRLGLERSLASANDVQTVRSANALRLQTVDALVPQVTFSGQTSTREINLAAQGFQPAVISRNLPPGTPPLKEIVKVSTTSAQLNLNQQIFNLPAYEVYRAARDFTREAELNALLNRANTIQQVAVQYLLALSDVASIRNVQAQVQSDRELERQAEARKDAGAGTNLDLIRARVERQQREQQLVQTENSFEKDKIQLNRYMGLAAEQPLELVDAVPYHELTMLPLGTAREVAYRRRKDLLSLEAQLRLAQRQRTAIRYERLPVAKVNGFYGVQGVTRGLYHGVFNVQGGIDVPIFLEARIRGDQAIADATLVSLRSQMKSLHEDVEEQLRSAMLDVGANRDLVNVATSNVDLAGEVLSETLERYRAGVDDTLPVVRAQASLANAQAQMVSALFQFNQSKLLLARQTGVLEAQYDTYLGQ